DRHGAPLCFARLLPRLAQKTPEARRVDAAAQAFARVSAVCDGALACLGARRATGQRCRVAARYYAAADCAWTLGVANDAHRRRSRDRKSTRLNSSHV